MSNNMMLGSADWNLWPISMDYEKTFPEFKKAGITHVELGIYHPSTELTADNRARIAKLAADNQLGVTAALFSLTPDKWPEGAFSHRGSGFLQECAVFLDALEAMGIKFANIWTGADLPDANTEETSSTLTELNDLAKKFSGVVSIEYKADTVFPDGISLANTLSKHTHLKVLIDTGHAFALEEDVVELIKDLHQRKLMGAMHLGDAIAGDSDADLPCGRVHDFSDILKTLSDINYSGTANFDLYGAAVDEDGPGPLSILEESLNYMNGAIRARS
jgi:sugar phosphate isomerase/epimerase